MHVLHDAAAAASSLPCPFHTGCEKDVSYSLKVTEMTNASILVQMKIEVGEINVIAVQGLPVNVTACISDLCPVQADLQMLLCLP